MKEKFGVYKSKPSKVVTLVLTLLVILEVGLIWSTTKSSKIELWNYVDGIVFVFIWIIPLTTPVVSQLRNVFVLLSWILICGLWFAYKVEQDILTAIAPFTVLIYSQLSRLLFRYTIGYHPIHLYFLHSAIHRYSEIDMRKSTKVDYRYSVTYYIIALILIVIAFKVKQ